MKTDAPLTLLWGNADVLKERAVKQIVEAQLEEGDREFGLIRLYANEVGLDGIVAELQSGSLMAPQRVVVVRNVTALSNAEQKQLAARLKELQPGLTVVLVAAKDLDARGWGVPVAADLRKAIEANGQIVEMRAPDERSLPRWAMEEMQALGKSLRPDAAAMLCEYGGTDTDRLLRELEKLASYVGKRDEVTVEDVQAVSVRVTEADVFALMDAIGSKDAATALALLDGVVPEGADRGEFIPFLGMVARQIRLIWQARYLRQRRISPQQVSALPAEVAGHLPERHGIVDATKGNKGWLLEKFTRQAAMFSDGQLARALDRICQADLALKGGGGKLDQRTVVELLIAELCR